MDFGTKILQELYNKFENMSDVEYNELIKQANEIEYNLVQQETHESI